MTKKMVDEANRAWAERLAGWAIPDDLVAATSESPFFSDPSVCVRAADEALARPDDTPSDPAARAALPNGGTVLDVGVGAGPASLRLDPDRNIGVDLSPDLPARVSSEPPSAGSSPIASRVDGSTSQTARRWQM